MTSYDEFRDTWRGTTIRTTSPNGCVHLTNTGDRQFEVTCDDAWFHRVNASDFAAQIVKLLRTALVDRTRAYRRQFELTTGLQIDPEDVHRSPRVRSYSEQRDAIEAEGVSTDGGTSVASIGMRHFVVAVNCDQWSNQDQHGIERGLGEAIEALAADQFRKMYDLKQARH